jgi:hypothetical protein
LKTTPLYFIVLWIGLFILAEKYGEKRQYQVTANILERSINFGLNKNLLGDKGVALCLANCGTSSMHCPLKNP